MKELSIIPECYVDTNLTETLIFGVEVNHQKGCGTVANTMMNKFGDSFALGIIDKDKQELDYLKEFTELSRSNNLILYKHPEKNHYFLQVYPAMEKFIIQNMEKAGMGLEEYDLPTDFDLFKKTTKSINSKEDVTLKKVFKKLLKERSPEILLFQNWINHLRNNKYTASDEELQALNNIAINEEE